MVVFLSGGLYTLNEKASEVLKGEGVTFQGFSFRVPLTFFLAFVPSPSLSLSFFFRQWTHWDLNPGPSACEEDVIPLHHEPNKRLLDSAACRMSSDSSLGDLGNCISSSELCVALSLIF